MPDNSYSELLTAEVELNLTDFKAKMKAADASIARLSGGKKHPPVFEMSGSEIVRAAIDATENFAYKVMEQSLEEVPKHTGVLENSWNVSQPHVVGNRVKVTLGYGYGDEINADGRTASQYALPVHEIYEATHNPPEKDHFLLDPLLLHSKDLGLDITTAIRRTVNGQRITTMIMGGELLGMSELGEVTDVAAFRGSRTGRSGRMIRGRGGRFVGAIGGSVSMFSAKDVSQRFRGKY